MKPLADLCRPRIKVIPFKAARINCLRFAVLLLCILSMAGASAQTVTWSDSFIQLQQPTTEQCRNWSSFLDQLGGKTFASVTISGSRDLTGKTLSDPTAATQLANLLYTRTPGTVVSPNGDTWTVSNCFDAACTDGKSPYSISLSYNGNTETCACEDTYAIRPQTKGGDWGGLNSARSCGAASQTMRVEFNSGVSVVAEGSTAICKGGSVLLKAKSDICSGDGIKYLWSNNATTPSIEASVPGDYHVTVYNEATKCSATSSKVTVSVIDISVNAGADAVYCAEPVQLMAQGQTNGNAPSTSASRFCIFDASNGGNGDCQFTAVNVCFEEVIQVSTATYTQAISVDNPVELRYYLHHTSQDDPAEFIFKINGNHIGTFVETDPSGVCLEMPRTATFSEDQFRKYWLNGVENILTVEIIKGGAGLYLAGIAVEIVSSNETYSWSPAEGLTSATIKNPLAKPLTTTLYTVTYKDASGCAATDNVEVKVDCTLPPVAVCKVITRDLVEGCEISVAAAEFDGGSKSLSNGTLTFSASPAGPYKSGTTSVVLTVTDSNGKISNCTSSITVNDAVLPTIAQPEDITDVLNDPNLCTATITLSAPVANDNCGLVEPLVDKTVNLPVGESSVLWAVTDLAGNSYSVTQKVIVTNPAPEIQSVVLSASTAMVNMPVIVTTSYLDNNASTATINWGDASAPQILSAPAAIFEATHAYAYAGTYSVTVTVTDLCGATTERVSEPIVISVARNGSVSGSGWFESPRGAFVKDPLATGKATFGFTARYTAQGNVPVGTTSFNFKAARLKFKSTQYYWLQVDGTNAVLKGTGSVNNERGYDILIAMADDDENADTSKKDKKASKKKDRIRVKIWDPQGVVIYDTQIGEADNAIASTPVGGGSIEVENSTDVFRESIETTVTAFGEESTSVYPNPFIDWINVQFNTGSTENVVLKLMDLGGKLIASAVCTVSEDGSYSLDIPGETPEGIYVLTIKQGTRVELLKVVHN